MTFIQENKACRGRGGPGSGAQYNNPEGRYPIPQKRKAQKLNTIRYECRHGGLKTTKVIGSKGAFSMAKSRVRLTKSEKRGGVALGKRAGKAL